MKKNIFISTAGVFGSAFLWLISFKIVAVWLGPAGVGLFGQLRQLLQAGGIAGTLGGTNPVVQGISERTNDAERMRFRATVSRIIGGSAILVSATVFLFASPIALISLGSSEPAYKQSIQWLSFAVLAYAGAIYMMGVFNGYRRYSLLAIIQLSGPTVLVGALAVATYSGLGASPAIFALFFLACFGAMYVTGFLLSRVDGGNSPISLPKHYLSWPETTVFLRFAISTLGATLLGSISLLTVRAMIIKSNGFEGAGIFDASWTISFNYLTLLLTACSNIYLPALTGAVGSVEKGKHIAKTAYAVLAVVIFICYLITILSIEMITLLYSNKFNTSDHLLRVLGIAILFRSISWVFSMLVVADKNSKMLLASECLYNGSMLLSVWAMTSYFQSIEMIGWAFVATNIIYLCFIGIYVWRSNSSVPVATLLVLTIGAALPLLALSVLEPLGLFSMSYVYAKLGVLMLGLILSAVSWRQFLRVTRDVNGPIL